MKEIWKEHQSGLLVSSLGRVKLTGTGRGKYPNGHITFGCDNSYGYLMIRYKYKGYLVHRLVAETFILNPDNLPQVNHKNEIKIDNRVENLEWCTQEYNLKYGNRIKKYSKPVLQYDLDGNFIREWTSATEAAKQLGFKQNGIVQCLKGKLKTSYGYIWRYKE